MNAFENSNDVFCLSFHHFEQGFYPGTGLITDVGKNNGTWFNLNIPLKVCSLKFLKPMR